MGIGTQPIAVAAQTKPKGQSTALTLFEVLKISLQAQMVQKWRPFEVEIDKLKKQKSWTYS
jgi:hypothetical protein